MGQPSPSHWPWAAFVLYIDQHLNLRTTTQLSRFGLKLIQLDRPISISLLKGFWRQQPALRVISYSCHPRGKYKNGVSNPAVTKEIAAGEVSLAVCATLISFFASLATPLCHQGFGAGRGELSSIQFTRTGCAGWLLSWLCLLPPPAFHYTELLLISALPGAPSVPGK